MSKYDESVKTSAPVKAEKFVAKEIKNKTALDYVSLALTTFGVGFIPLAPGTWGSAIGVLIYLTVRKFETGALSDFARKGFHAETLTAWIYAINALFLLIFCLLGIWAANRASEIFQTKDPQKVVVDEVIGQLITFLFVPFAISSWLVVAGFLLFRLFDIWKPYPINSLENLPAGLGVCADDILAGVYAGICLALIYAAQLSF